MTFDQIQPDVAYLREREPTFLKDFSDVELLSMQMTVVRTDLRLDLCEALGLDPNSQEDAATLDTIATARTPQIRQALTVLQLFHIWDSRDIGLSAEHNVRRAKSYRSQYQTLRSTFSGLRSRKSGRARTTIRTRRL